VGQDFFIGGGNDWGLPKAIRYKTPFSRIPNLTGLFVFYDFLSLPLITQPIKASRYENHSCSFSVLEIIPQNNSMTNISVVFSCEHYIDSTPRGSNNYLGHWLNGTDTTYWANNPHYLRDAFVIFEEQIPGWLSDVYDDDSTYANSITINNYQWFTYGRVPLNELREGDHAADYIDRYCSNQQRIMEAQYESKVEKENKLLNKLYSDFHIYPNPTSHTLFIEEDLDIEFIQIKNMYNQLVMYINPNTNFKAIDIKYLSSGVYYLHIKLKNQTSTQQIKFIKM